MQILQTWNRMSRFPGGNILFSKFLGAMVPYTGTLGAIVDELRPGYARVRLRDRRGVRNHLNSIHAVALMNLGEISSGLSFISNIPDDARAILVGYSIEYVKKARGTLIAEATSEKVLTSEPAEFQVESVIKDQGGDVVARAKAKWKVGPNKK